MEKEMIVDSFETEIKIKTKEFPYKVMEKAREADATAYIRVWKNVLKDGVLTKEPHITG